MMIEEILRFFPTAYFRIGIRYLLAASIAFGVFYLLFRSYFHFRKIQPKFPKITDYRRDLAYSLFTIALFALIALITFIPLKPYTLLYQELSDKSLGYWFLTVIPIFFIHDFYFYWAHRLMHHPKLFRSIHKVHHLSTNPSPWTAYAFHPLEALIEVSIIPILAFTVPTHRVVIVFFMVFQIIFNVYAHLGYELFPRGFHKSWLGRWVNTSVAHNLHHHRFHGNYGLYTLIWDRLFGTIRTDYDPSYQEVTERSREATAA
jgi:sterol desaturase/sphingolipid hydroxylase (fatty acid hydroxylase superfamily)